MGLKKQFNSVFCLTDVRVYCMVILKYKTVIFFLSFNGDFPPARPILSYLVFCFLILPVWDDFYFCLHFLLTWEILRTWNISLHSRMLFFFSLLSSICVCEGGKVVDRQMSTAICVWLWGAKVAKEYFYHDAWQRLFSCRKQC